MTFSVNEKVVSFALLYMVQLELSDVEVNFRGRCMLLVGHVLSAILDNSATELHIFG